MPVIRTVFWNASTAPGVLGYKLYAGTRTGVYDDANSPKDMGNVTSGTYLPAHNSTRFYVLTVYSATEESNVSSEFEFIHPNTKFFG